MIRGYRWIETGRNVWQYEGPAGSRHFHGIVHALSDGSSCFSLPGGWHAILSDGRMEEHGCGYRKSVREAKDEIERTVRVKLGMECDHGIRDGDWCGQCNKEVKEARRQTLAHEPGDDE